MTPQSFIAELAAYKLPAVFNPYAEHCPTHDRVDGLAAGERTCSASSKR